MTVAGESENNVQNIMKESITETMLYYTTVVQWSLLSSNNLFEESRVLQIT